MGRRTGANAVGKVRHWNRILLLFPRLSLSRARLTFFVIFQGSERYLVLIFVMEPSIMLKANCCPEALSSGEDVIALATGPDL
jgi:hypothetical protein